MGIGLGLRAGGIDRGEGRRRVREVRRARLAMAKKRVPRVRRLLGRARGRAAARLVAKGGLEAGYTYGVGRTGL